MTKLEASLKILYSSPGCIEDFGFKELCKILEVNMDHCNQWKSLREASEKYLQSLLKKLV
jgi:hypothetical protein